MKPLDNLKIHWKCQNIKNYTTRTRFKKKAERFSAENVFISNKYKGEQCYKIGNSINYNKLMSNDTGPPH